MNITSIRFNNYKALGNYSVALQSVNILVGPNNSGKSTILSAFRILEYGLRIANAKTASRVLTFEGFQAYGHKLSELHIPTSLENVHTNYSDANSKIEFKFSNKNCLTLFFPSDGGCFLYWSVVGKQVKTPSAFKQQFPINIQVVPVLGPIEKEEIIVTEETVRRTSGTPGASRHFRNYWHQNPNGFSIFKLLIEKTWKGMSIKPPEITDHLSRRLVMFCTEDRADRELYWAGFGFQIWCQLLTHISRASKSDLIIIDEPEVYLHPDVQRQLLSILREVTPDIILATHSTEILGEADPAEILLIDKTMSSARRLKDIEGVQEAVASMGSIQNITLTHLARTKKIIFVEGMHDYKVLRRFSKLVGLTELASGNYLTPLESGGFTSIDKVKAFAWGMNQKLNADIAIGAIYDRDYWCDQEIAEKSSSLKKSIAFAHIHTRKEIENYLLHPRVLGRTLESAIVEREQRSDTILNRDESIEEILIKLTEDDKVNLQSQYMSKYRSFFKHIGKDDATLDAEAINWFNLKWDILDSRMEVVSGKTVLRDLRTYVNEKWAVTLTDFKIIDEFKAAEVPNDLLEMLKALDVYRLS